MSSAVPTTIPAQLASQAQRLVEHGWADNLDALVAESLRRFLESHPESLTEQFLREDVQWALYGSD